MAGLTDHLIQGLCPDLEQSGIGIEKSPLWIEDVGEIVRRRENCLEVFDLVEMAFFLGLAANNLNKA
jgi:hypothetical protein